MANDFVVYILYSKKLKCYYIGETYNIKQRMVYHNDSTLNFNSTKTGIPWDIYYLIHVKDRNQARKIEFHIKRMKSRVYIENLKKYPEMIDKLREKYSE